MSQNFEELASKDEEEIRSALRELPTLMPPERAWRRLDTEIVRAESIAHPNRSTRRWLQAASVAGVALIAGLLTTMTLRYTGTFDEPSQTEEAPSSGFPGTDRGDAAYSELVAESIRLDRLLRELPAQPGLMPVRTAGTIVELEDQIALIDAHLSMGAASDIRPQYRNALWQDRVDLMNALVHVRAAHAQRHEF